MGSQADMGSQIVVQVKHDGEWKTVQQFKAGKHADFAAIADEARAKVGGIEEVRVLESNYHDENDERVWKQRYASTPSRVPDSGRAPAASPSDTIVERFKEAPRHDSQLNELVPIYFKNLALILLTLSGYRFWARTYVRRFLWGHTRFLDDPLIYLGRPKELLIGFLLVVVFIFLPFAAVVLVALLPDLGLDLDEGGSFPNLLNFLPFLLFILISFLISVAVYSARRYRLSRTAWRGIRGTVTGSAWKYGFWTLWYLFLTLITFGWYFPWMRMNLASRRIDNSRFGNLQFIFHGKGNDLLGVFFIYLILGGAFSGLLENIDEDVGPFISAAGYWLCLLGYRAKELRYIADNSKLGTISLEFTFTQWEYIRYVLGNALISIITLTTGWAFLQRRQFQFWQKYLVIRGSIDPLKFRQAADANTQTGEGLAELFDQEIDTGFDVGF